MESFHVCISIITQNHTNYPFFQYYSANNHFVNRVGLHLIHFGTFSYVWKLYMQFGIVNMYLLEWKPLKILSYFQIKQRTRHDIDIKLSHLKSMTCMWLNTIDVLYLSLPVIRLRFSFRYMSKWSPWVSDGRSSTLNQF